MRASFSVTERRHAAFRAAALIVLALLACAGRAAAAQIAATVTDEEGHPLADAVVVAVPAQGALPPAQPGL